jgi:drug/metabolite transporter (DMT)-like permease
VSVVLALLAALVYGVSDFFGGLASRGAKALTVLIYNYPFGAVIMVALLPFFPGHVSGRTLAWSCAGGAFGLFGVGLLYSALAIAPMNVVSPITAVLTAVVPVVFGVATGERPGVSAWIGIVVGMVAVVLISRTPSDHPHGPVQLRPVLMAIGAGFGFGGYFICLARSDVDSGLWPVVIARIAAALLVFPVALYAGALTVPPPQVLRLALFSGALDAGANLFFLLATRHGYLSIASVLTALYPAGTVALAAAVLHERTGRWQRVGLALAAGSVVLVAR